VPSVVSAVPFVLSEAPTEPELVAKYFRALGDETRVRVLRLLDERGEVGVGSLVEELGVAQPKVSNHLACLRWCGFVVSRRDGRRILYSIADDRVRELLALSQALLADNAEHVAACGHLDHRAADVRARG
jgi:ArsR family transcriptional regulator, cadmium/lead-responsive transcriptional repressor